MDGYATTATTATELKAYGYSESNVSEAGQSNRLPATCKDVVDRKSPKQSLMKLSHKKKKRAL